MATVLNILEYMEKMEEDTFEIIQLKDLPRELIENPYKFITYNYESMYRYTGGKIFEILALMPTSMILPKIVNNGKEIRQRINLFLLAPVASGKSAICKEFSKIAYNSITSANITPARLFYELNKSQEGLAVIIPDASISLLNEELVKLLENYTGDEGCIFRSNMRTKGETMIKKEGIGLFAGTLDLINNQVLRDGLMSRSAIVLNLHTIKEHENILREHSATMGRNALNRKNIDYIKSYYIHLKRIQEGYGPIEKITDYDFDEIRREEITDFLIKIIEETKSFKNLAMESTRDLEQAYRYMVNHAFLNIFKRKVENGKLFITEEDVSVAKKLIANDLRIRSRIYAGMYALNLYHIKTINDLRRWWYNETVNKKKPIAEESMVIMSGLVKK